MNQLPIFVTIRDRKVILIGDGDAADAKRRFIQRAGGLIVGPECEEAILAFVAVEEATEAAAFAAHLKSRGLLINVVDQPTLCDFTTPAVIDRDPVLIAIGTGGASAGLAKALRQRLEIILPQSLGILAKALSAARDAIRNRWPDNSTRRKAIDAALSEGALLDPLSHYEDSSLQSWLKSDFGAERDELVTIALHSQYPDDLTLGQARLLGQADHIFHAAMVPQSILNRARADATRTQGVAPQPLPNGLVIQLEMQEHAA